MIHFSKNFSFAWAAVLVLTSAAPSILAQGRAEIVIGMSVPLTGFNAAAGQEGLAVARAYFERVNRSGDIAGNKISLLVLGDAFAAQRAAANARTAIDAKAVAIFNCWGTSSCSAMMPVINRAGVPMVAGIAGGGPMRKAVGSYAFNVRATTEREIARMVNQMLTVGQDHIALIFQGDAFGKSGQEAAASVFASTKVRPVVELAVKADGKNASEVVAALAKLPQLNSVVLVAAPPATLKLIPRAREAGAADAKEPMMGALIPRAREAGLAVQFYNLAA